jgi:hypothetical protein
MSVPSVKTIKQIDWLDKLAEPDLAVTVVRQAMEWAEGAGAKPALKRYADEQGFTLAPRSYSGRVYRALEIMDAALETFGVESAAGRGGGIMYANTGEIYAPTVIFDEKSETWKVTSVGDLVESYPSRFR